MRTFAERVAEWRERVVSFELHHVAEERLAICRNCPHHRVKIIGGIWCSLCGCGMHLKTRLMEFQCPDDPPRWERY